MTAVQQLMMSAGSRAVSLRSAGATIIQTSSTTVAPAVPSGVPAGDLLVAVIMRRSAVASDPPSGWTLVSNAGSASDGSFTQWSQVYTKTATGLEAGGAVTFTQASAGRMIGQILSIVGSSGTPILESHNEAIVNSTATNTVAFPSISASGSGRLGIAVGSIISALGTPTTISADNGWALQGPGSIVDNRMGVFAKALASGANTSGTMTSSATGFTVGTTANALIFAAP